MNLLEELRGQMIRHRFRPERKLSQEFTTNKALLIYITNLVGKNKTVLEIGAGTGFLTRELLKNNKVIAFEKDEILGEVLEKEFEKEIKEKKLVVVKKDFLEEDLEKFKADVIASIPPVNISSKIVEKIIKSKIKECLIVFDKGFVEKLTSVEGMKEYNSLTVMLKLNSKTRIMEEISKESFYPKANSEKQLIQIVFERKETSQKFFDFLKQLFRYRNKDLSKAIKQSEKFFEKTIGKKIVLPNEKISQKKVYLMTPKEFLEVFQKK